MAKVFIEETTLTAIGDAIRAKEGTSDLIPVTDMGTRISAIETGGGSAGEDGDFQDRMIERQLTEIKASDIPSYTTTIGRGTFEYNESLEKVALPNHVTAIQTYAFSNCHSLRTVTMPNNSSLYLEPAVFDGCNNLQAIYCHEYIPEASETFVPSYAPVKIYVPADALDSYYEAPIWGNTYVRNMLTTSTPYIGSTTFKAANNRPATITLDVMGLDSSKNYTCLVSEHEHGSIIENQSFNDDMTKLSFTVRPNGYYGEVTIWVILQENGANVFTRTISGTLVEEIITGNYTVETPDDASYGFTLADDGFYESTNTSVDGSCSYCKVTISNPSGLPVYFDYYQNTENGYDYGMVSYANVDIPYNGGYEGAEDNAQYVFVNIDGSIMQTLVLEDATDGCYYTVKYKKDDSGANGDDKFRFRFRIE